MTFVSYLKPQDRKKVNVKTVKMLLSIADNQISNFDCFADSGDIEYWLGAKKFYTELLQELGESV